ncbi:hypothetical protein ETU10_04865 [Apibacter muscae]|uniref:hypothetical protein n=1 Tax=Apibacter muscae TaxID=2509004 RepID=UPI0011ADC0C1|nr:hypothetical protein [Apibacter muscae]TWP24017.1 hypothetical protein ETU10_04865 [Apibacter muscae]
MKVFQLYKIKITLLLFVVLLLFKVVNLQEYLHIHKDHVENSSHKKSCDLCNSIFHYGKTEVCQNFEFENFRIKVNQLVLIQEKSIGLIISLHNKYLTTQLYNRPPPSLS